MIIAITGYAGSGKDTIGEYIQQKYNYKRFAFADMIKRLCSVTFNNDEEYYHNQDLKLIPMNFNFDYQAKQRWVKFLTSDMKIDRQKASELFEIAYKYCSDGSEVNNRVITTTSRNVIQKIGEETLKKCYDYDIWLKFCPSGETFTVITDMRFPDEYKLVKDLNGVVIKVTNTNNKQSKMNHVSESFIDNINADYYIDNDGINIDNLYKSVDNVLNNLEGIKNVHSNQIFS